MLRFIVRLGVLAVVVYAGLVLGYPLYQYVMMRRTADEAATMGAAQWVALRKTPWREELVWWEVTVRVTDLMRERANQFGVDLSDDQVRVFFEPDVLRVRTDWEADARFPGYVHRYRFRVEARHVMVHR
jgi:hypothetical protein